MFDSHAEAGPKQQDILQPSCIYHSSITESQAPPTHEITKRDVRVTEKQEGRLGRVTEPLCESSETEKVRHCDHHKAPAASASAEGVWFAAGVSRLCVSVGVKG